MPEKDLAAAEQDLHQSQLAREAAELKLRSMSVAPDQQGLYWLTAPRDGVVVERAVLAGQEVGPERTDPLLVVGELDEVIVTADVPESEVADVRVGQTAAITSAAAPEHPFQGHVEYVGEVVDPVRRMVNVRIRVPNPERALRPNAFVQVSFSSEGKGHVVTAADAVVTDDDHSFVFVQSPGHPGTFERRNVVPGHRRGNQIEILSGLQPGDTYVSKGAILLLNATALTE